MNVQVMALQKAFYNGELKPQGARFSWEVPKAYIEKAQAEGLQLKDVMPKYLDLIGDVPRIEPKKVGAKTNTTPINDGDDGNEGMSIELALKQLDHANDDHWNESNGKPSTKAVTELVGRKVTRAEIEDVDPDFVRQESQE